MSNGSHAPLAAGARKAAAAAFICGHLQIVIYSCSS